MPSSEDSNAHLPIPASIASGGSSSNEHAAQPHQGNLWGARLYPEHRPATEWARTPETSASSEAWLSKVVPEIHQSVGGWTWRLCPFVPAVRQHTHRCLYPVCAIHGVRDRRAHQRKLWTLPVALDQVHEGSAELRRLNRVSPYRKYWGLCQCTAPVAIHLRQHLARHGVPLGSRASIAVYRFRGRRGPGQAPALQQDKDSFGTLLAGSADQIANASWTMNIKNVSNLPMA